MQDVRYAFRRLARRPGYTLLTILTLALGIGASTAVFSVVDQTVLRPPPFAHANRLVDVININRATGSGGNTLTARKTLAWQGQRSVFEHLELYAPRQYDVSGGTEPERIDGRLVSTGLFPMLGVQPRLGRGFGDEDGRPGSEPVAVISEDVWKRRYGGDADVLGRHILLNDEPHTIVGVMPRRFQLHGDTEAVYLPYHLGANESDTTTGGFFGLGRLAPGVAPADAQELVDAVGLPLETEAPLPGTWALRVTPKKVARVNDTTKTALFVLLGAVGFVLLITCANVANMFLSQAAQRQREMAVRSAVGASRWRLVREVLTESLLLAAGGGALGILAAHWGVQALVAAAPANLAFQATSPVEIDARILAVAATVTLLTGFLFGIVPALRGSRPNLEGTLRGGSGAAGRRSQGRMPGALVAAEVAFALVLLVGAALMIRTMTNLEAIEPGFEPAGLISMQLAVPSDRYPTPTARHEFFEAVAARLAGLGGVTDVTATTGLPPSGGGITFGRPHAEGSDAPGGDPSVIPFNTVAPSYFRTMRIPVLAGRTFEEGDARTSVIISRAFADRLWPEGNPVGRRFRMSEKDDWITVVGVAGNVEGREGESRTHLAFYYPLLAPSAAAIEAAAKAAAAQTGPPRRSYVSRTIVLRAENPRAVLPLLTDAVWGLDPQQPVQRVGLVADTYAAAFARQRFVLQLMAAFALVALVLTAAGVFAVLSQLVSQRTREIGVRMALGARPADVLRLVLARGMRPAAIGVVLGLAGAFWLSRFLEALLFEVQPTDPASFAAVTGLLAAVALAACWLPARAAMKVEPAVALRVE
jgi:putative ABC transport system permease protein